MITLEKLAGYEPEADILDKVAEAMDYLDAAGIDPIGGLTAIYNVDEDGYALDERVASALSRLDDYQLEALENVAAYLADEDPSEVAAIALELERVAGLREAGRELLSSARAGAGWLKDKASKAWGAYTRAFSGKAYRSAKEARQIAEAERKKLQAAAKKWYNIGARYKLGKSVATGELENLTKTERKELMKMLAARGAAVGAVGGAGYGAYKLTSGHKRR